MLPTGLCGEGQTIVAVQLFVVDDGKPLNANKHYRGIYVALEKPRKVRNDTRC